MTGELTLQTHNRPQKLSLKSALKFAFLGLAVATLPSLPACTPSSANPKPNLVYKDAPKPEIVAKINGQEITLDELIGDEKLAFHELKKREHEMLMDRFNAILEEKLVTAEAEKAGISKEEFLKKNVIKGEIKIEDKDYKDFLKDKRIPESQLNDKLKDRIMDALREQKRGEFVQAFLAKVTENNPVEVYLKKPKLQVNVEVGQAPLWGKEDAPVTIIEFSDFQCPFCMRAHETVNEVKKKYAGKVKLAFKHFPLPMHKQARPASEASMCIHEQSPDKFWKYSDLLFANQKSLDDPNLEKFAKDVGIDVGKYKDCLNAKKFADLVQQDLSYGEKLGVRSTPTFFVNGQIISGAQPLEAFAEMIDEELEAKKN